jgi:hypothetical protein
MYKTHRPAEGCLELTPALTPEGQARAAQEDAHCGLPLLLLLQKGSIDPIQLPCSLATVNSGSVASFSTNFPSLF